MTLHAPLIIDVAGTELGRADKKRLLHPLVGGLVLFARNWASRQQLTELCCSIKKLRPDVLICVDHEGGRVQRFKTDGFTHLPPMRSLGLLWQQEQQGQHDSGPMRATAAARACGYVLGAELRACGVDLSFTPVLDLDYGASSVIGDRAFAADAQTVSLLAQSLMFGLLQSGMANCGKHFPGHGFASSDSHTEMVLDQRSLQQILSTDGAPYRWLGNGLASVMAAHVIYPAVDSRSAGFSSRWLTDILRTQLGFDGAIFSDDLSMAGARVIDGESVGSSQATLAAIKAGCDLVLLCNQSLTENGALEAVLNDLSQARQRGSWQPLKASALRRHALLPKSPAPSWDQLRCQPAYVRALSMLPA